MKEIAFPLIVLGLALCQGCGTLAAYGPGHPTEEGFAMRKQYYPAVRGDCYAIRRVLGNDSCFAAKAILMPLFIIDLPISACFDSIAWPFKFAERRCEPDEQVPIK